MPEGTPSRQSKARVRRLAARTSSSLAGKQQPWHLALEQALNRRHRLPFLLWGQRTYLKGVLSVFLVVYIALKLPFIITASFIEELRARRAARREREGDDV